MGVGFVLLSPVILVVLLVGILPLITPMKIMQFGIIIIL